MEQNGMTEYNKNSNEILTQHEPFFINDVSIFTHKIFCGDERKPLFDDRYLHVFGGVANTAFNAEVLSYATQDGIQYSTFKNAVANVAADFKSNSVSAGVHSDTHSETTDHLDTHADGDIGCGYIKLRRTISQKIIENPDAIVAEAERLRPELFTDPTDTSFGHDVVRSHAQLTANDEFFSTGSREVAAAAIEQDAPSMLVEGDHTASLGIINLNRNSTIDSAAAYAACKSIYVHDAWASAEMAHVASNSKAFDKREWEIADLIDAIGTMWALGVTTIAVRR